MKKTAVMFVGTLLVISTNCFASERADKERAVMEAQGIFQAFERQVESGKEQRLRQFDLLISDFKASHVLTSEHEEKVQLLFDQIRRSYEEKLSTAQERAHIWEHSYLSQFSDEELDQLIAYYTSPLGKKDIQISDRAGRELRQYLALKAEQAMKEVLQQLQKIEKECNCIK